MTITKRIVFALCVTCCAALSGAQSANNQSFAAWYEERLNVHIDDAVKRLTPAPEQGVSPSSSGLVSVDKVIERFSPTAGQVVGMNGKGTDRQKESPAADPRSTSLVDQSSATDFISIAANVIPVTPGLSQFIPPTETAGSSAAGSTTATASLYSLMAAFNRVKPLDPQFYKAHITSRQFSFTIGTAASELATDNTDKPAVVYGAKYLVINRREIYTAKNQQIIDRIANIARTTAATSVKLVDAIQQMMFIALHPEKANANGLVDPNDKDWQDFAIDGLGVNFPSTLAALPAEAKNKIEEMIEKNIEPFVKYKNDLNNAYDAISKATQMSIAYTANIRDAKGNNYHRAELIFDYGLSSRINWTVNASADYTDRKSSTDSKGGRFATSFQGDLTKSNSAWGKTPIRLTFSGEGKWQTSQKPQYTFESKLTIPLASGIDLPIAYRYANRIAQINETNSEARLGLSIDISRLAQAFK